MGMGCIGVWVTLVLVGLRNIRENIPGFFDSSGIAGVNIMGVDPSNQHLIVPYNVLFFSNASFSFLKSSAINISRNLACISFTL